jgi:hypothetical protein
LPIDHWAESFPFSLTGVVENSMRQLVFYPPISDAVRCINISFGDDDLVEQDQFFMIIFTPSNTNDVFVGGNVANVTIVDDEGTSLPECFRC